MKFPDFENEAKYLALDYDFVAGCDEVGRGPLAGPVVAASCILNPALIKKTRNEHDWYYRVRDSKTINEPEREKLAKIILDNTLAYGVGVASPEEIDELNIHNATLLAMRRATEEMLGKISSEPRKVILFIDGQFKIPELNIQQSLEQKNVVKGDAEVLSISAASIIAKVHRDNIMKKLGKQFPEYGFAKHKGYGTREHRTAIKKLGPTNFHRKSFLKKVF